MEGFYPSNSQAIEAPRVPRLYATMFTTFRGGQSGAWRVTLNSAVKGEALAAVPALSITQNASIALPILPSSTSWRLVGVTSHLRYVEKAEKEQLSQQHAPLGRKEATFAALIPIRKSAAWWELNQDERREILEAKSHHISGTLKYLPQVARQLYHCRDLGEGLPQLSGKSGGVLGVAQLAQMRYRRLVADQPARAVAQHRLFFVEDECHEGIPDNAGVDELTSLFVMPGLVPGIHVFCSDSK